MTETTTAFEHRIGDCVVRTVHEATPISVLREDRSARPCRYTTVARIEPTGASPGDNACIAIENALGAMSERPQTLYTSRWSHYCQVERDLVWQFHLCVVELVEANLGIIRCPDHVKREVSEHADRNG